MFTVIIGRVERRARGAPDSCWGQGLSLAAQRTTWMQAWGIFSTSFPVCAGMKTSTRHHSGTGAGCAETAPRTRSIETSSESRQAWWLTHLIRGRGRRVPGLSALSQTNQNQQTPNKPKNKKVKKVFTGAENGGGLCQASLSSFRFVLALGGYPHPEPQEYQLLLLDPIPGIPPPLCPQHCPDRWAVEQRCQGTPGC